MSKSYYQEPNATVYCGHVLDVLRELPAESSDCIVTSPPYWGLRSYKTEPVIWDNYSGCEHEWGDASYKRRSSDGMPGFSKERYDIATYEALRRDIPVSSAFCLKCHAWKGELGLEPTIELYISHLLQIFDEVKRVLKKTGTCWVNIGDSYASSGGPSRHRGYFDPKWPNARKGDFDEPSSYPQSVESKSLCLIPERFALGMVERGWILRNIVIWYKSNPMPESVKDRFTGTYEYVYFFTKSRRYFFEQQFEPYSPITLADRRIIKIQAGVKLQRIRNKDFKDNCIQDARDVRDRALRSIDISQGRNLRDVWQINTQPYPEAHFATFPEDLVKTPILAGCPQDGIVLDPFCGSGTTLAVAKMLGRQAIGIDINSKYCDLTIKRLQAIPIPMELHE